MITFPVKRYTYVDNNTQQHLIPVQNPVAQCALSSVPTIASWLSPLLRAHLLAGGGRGLEVGGPMCQHPCIHRSKVRDPGTQAEP